MWYTGLIETLLEYVVIQQVSPEIQKRVESRISECLDKVAEKYGVSLAWPVIEYNIRGTTAGYAYYNEWKVRFNPVLLNENVDKFIERTVAHEIAHLATFKIFPETNQRFASDAGHLQRPKREVHGPKWKSMMVLFGAPTSRCHSYNVSSVAQNRANKYTYVCSGCGAELSLTARKHNALVNDPRAIWHRGCKSSLLTLKSKPASVQASVARKANGESKQAQANRIVKENPGAGRSATIQMFILRLNVSKAHASTLYYNATKS